MNGIVLRTEGLVKRFGALAAVDGLSLSVREGEVFGLLGPNGAGKTTTIAVICGMLRPDGGTVFFHGRAVHPSDRSVRTSIGFCPQRISLWERLTAREQLVFAAGLYGVESREAGRRADALLAAMDLGSKARVQARFLSGGMQRRLNLAMAFVHEPELAVLDEPEAGLDPQSRVLVREYIRTQSRKRTVILTTHNMDEAERTADRIAVIDHGKLLVTGTPEELKRREGEGDVIEIDLGFDASLASDIPGSTAGALVAGIHGEIPGTAASVSGRRLTVRTFDGLNRLPALLALIRRSGLVPADVRLRGNSLEDVFLGLTGRTLRE